VKTCPRCGLIHADADFVCRRCRVDLLTGEPVKAAAAAPSKPTKPALDLKKFRGLGLAALSGISRGLGRVQDKFSALVQKKVVRKKLEPTEQAQVSELVYCLKCGGEMKPAFARYYQSKALYPLLALALVLFGLSFLWRGLLITSALSLTGFFFYRALKVNLWRCTDCKHEMKRQKRKAAKARAKS